MATKSDEDQKCLLQKLELLEEQREHIHNVVDDYINKVVNAGKQWAESKDEHRPTYLEIVKKIDDAVELLCLRTKEFPGLVDIDENGKQVQTVPCPAPLDFTFAVFQPTANSRYGSQIGKTDSSYQQRPAVHKSQYVKRISMPNSFKSLHQSDKPWKLSPRLYLAGKFLKMKKPLKENVLFIMNRLTAKNFEPMAIEMRKLTIKTYEDLQYLVTLFWDKVTTETMFVETYAVLCKVMSGLKVPPPPNSNIEKNQATFRVLILTRCQQEFEADKTIIFQDPEEQRKKMEAEMPESPERSALIENTLYQMEMRRMKFYGNIRFLGELFKIGLLTENIMHDCIYRLIKAKDDGSLLAVSILINTVGQALDTEKAKKRMDSYFLQIGKLAEERKSRIRFNLKDVLDLRNNNWVPRKKHRLQEDC